MMSLFYRYFSQNNILFSYSVNYYLSIDIYKLIIIDYKYNILYQFIEKIK